MASVLKCQGQLPAVVGERRLWGCGDVSPEPASFTLKLAS